MCLLLDLSGTKLITPDKTTGISDFSLVFFRKAQTLAYPQPHTNAPQNNDVDRGSNCGAGNRILLLVLIVNFGEWPLEDLKRKLDPDGVVLWLMPICQETPLL